jgi:hypothetical protein
LSVLDAEIALVFCIFVSVLLRGFVAGEPFDRALHRLDPTYRNTRDMGRGLLIDPVDSLKHLPRDYGRYYGATFRPVVDPDVERLRHRAVRAWAESVVIGLCGMAAVGVVGALLRRVEAGLDRKAVLIVLVLLGIYWLRRLILEFRDPDGSMMAFIYMLGGVVAAGIAIGLVVGLPRLVA